MAVDKLELTLDAENELPINISVFDTAIDVVFDVAADVVFMEEKVVENCLKKLEELGSRQLP